jgi:hypothetical protein
MTSVFDELVEEYPAWWIDALGEHNHVGGLESTRWLLERAQLKPGAKMLDAGAFVGGAARRAALETGADVIAMDLGGDFLRAGRRMGGGDRVTWVTAASHNLPFRDSAFNSVWCMDAYIAPREFTRVAAPGARLCLCCEVPVDSRGGLEAFLEEWAELGWELAAHRQLSLEAAQAWRTAEADLVRHRPRYLQRYGERGYVMQLDILGDLVRSYELGEQGHGLFVFSR